MTGAHRPADRAALALAILCTGFLICILVAMPICEDQVFLDRGTIASGGETAILIGFILTALLNIASLIRVLWSMLRAQVLQTGDVGILAWALSA